MRQLLCIILTLAFAVSYPMEHITPEQRAAFQKEYPLLANMYDAEKQRLNDANEYLEQNNAYKLQQARKLNRTVNDRIILKIKNTKNGIKAAASLLPVSTGIGVSAVSLCTSFDKKIIKISFAAIALMLIKAGISIKRNYDPEFLLGTISGLGMTAFLDINTIPNSLAKHLFFQAISILKNDTAHTTSPLGYDSIARRAVSSIMGEYIANSIKKTESTWAIHAPFSNRTLLRDDQMVNVSFKTIGNVIAENKQLAGHEILYELLKNTAGEICYNTLAQHAPHCLNILLEDAFPEDCNPNTEKQELIKYVVTEGTGYILCAIASLIANTSIVSNVTNGTTAAINTCLRPLLPL